VERQQVQLVRQAVSPLRAVMVLFAFPAGFCALVLALHVLAPNGRPTPEELQATGQAALGTAAICCVAMLGVWMQFRFLKRAEARTDAGRP
jgi:hypothetical protein